MDKTITLIIRGAAGAFILFVLDSLINTGESTKKNLSIKPPTSCPLGLFRVRATGFEPAT